VPQDSSSSLDFGYSWAWTHGHAVLAGALALIAIVLLACNCALWAAVPAVLSVWALTAYAVVRLIFRADKPMTMPTQRFMPGGEGYVIDLGCGSGRTSIMVGRARVHAQITALDNFSARYIRDHGEARLMANLRIAGIEDRVTLERGDMLDLPYEDDSFDGAVSSYALDHLKSQIPRALAEAHRVLRPGGQLLLMVILPDLAMNIAYPGLVGLAFPSQERWHEMLADAGLELEAEGLSSGGGWFLARGS